MRCEDYPCCGHTDLDPCERQPYDDAGYYDTWIAGNEHALCDHEAGICDVWEDDDDDEDYDDTDADDVAQAIYEDGMAALDQMQADMGYEPSGWQDSY